MNWTAWLFDKTCFFIVLKYFENNKNIIIGLGFRCIYIFYFSLLLLFLIHDSTFSKLHKYSRYIVPQSIKLIGEHFYIIYIGYWLTRAFLNILSVRFDCLDDFYSISNIKMKKNWPSTMFCIFSIFLFVINVIFILLTRKNVIFIILRKLFTRKLFEVFR